MASQDPLSAAQRGRIRRLSVSKGEENKSEEGGEINVVPFLDIITNVLMFVLATVAVTFTATIDTTPMIRGNRPPITPVLDLTVLVVGDGFSLKTQGGNIATGCAAAGPGVAIPKKDSAYDYDSLRTCVTKLKSANPDFKTESHVTVSASPNVPYQVVINAVDAVRRSESGDELFPDVQFAVAR